MKCPTCSTKLVKNKDYYYCVNNDGVLLSARHLRKHDEVEHNEEHNDAQQDTNNEITCPNCSEKMHKADYDSTGIMIDSCMNCHYRWLDNGELTKIKTFKPNFSADDLLYLDSINMEIAKKSEGEMDDKIPGYATGRVSWLGRGLNAGNSERTVGWISGGFLFGTIRTFVRGSWIQKIVLLLAFVVFGLLVWFIAGDIKNTFR